MAAAKDSRTLLVLVNPKSGTGQAVKMFHQRLEPRLKQKNIPYELLLTQYAGHAREEMRKRDVRRQHSGLVVISGDGLLYEAFNGLYSKGEDALDVPVGLVPGGSGCALNCSVLRHNGQPLDGLNNLGVDASVRNVVSGAENKRSIPLDFIEMELGNGEKHLSFLGVTLGVVADGDIGTEWMRFVGYLRTYLHVGWRLIFPAPYKARVSYLPLERDADDKIIPVSPSDEPLKLPPLTREAPADWHTEIDSYHVVYALNLSMLDPLTVFARESSPGDGVMWLVFVRDGITRLELIRWFSAMSQGPDFDNPSLGIVPVRAFRIEPISPVKGILSLDGESVPFGPVQGQLLPQKGKIDRKSVV